MYLRGVNIMEIERKFLVKNINELDLSKYNHKTMKKIFTKTLILLTLFFASCSTSSMITLMDNDAETEWNDGKLWAFKSNDNYMVAMTINTSKDDYGTYQLDLIVENLTDTSIVFDPSLIVVKIGSGPKIQQLATYEYPARKNTGARKGYSHTNRT